jgi:serine/threonine protein kinase
MTVESTAAAHRPHASAEFDTEIGRGAHCVVYALACVKVTLKLSKRCDAHKALQTELALLERSVAHAHVVQVLGQNAAEGWLAMELVDGLSLAQVLELHGSLSQPQLVRAVSDVVAGLASLHAHGAPHRDLNRAP